MSSNKSSSLFKNCHLEKVVVYTTRSGRAVRAPQPVYVPQEFIARDDYSDESEDDSEEDSDDLSIHSDSEEESSDSDHIVELEVVAPKRRRLIPVYEDDSEVSEDDSVHSSDEEFLNDSDDEDEQDVTESEETATLSESDESDDEDIEDLLESDDESDVSESESDSENEEMLNVSIRRNGKVRYSYQNQRIPIPDDEDDIVVNYK